MGVYPPGKEDGRTGGQSNGGNRHSLCLFQVIYSTGQQGVVHATVSSCISTCSGASLGWGLMGDAQSCTFNPDPHDQSLLIDTTQYLQLLTFLARQKAPASCLEENDVPGYQLLSLPL